MVVHDPSAMKLGPVNGVSIVQRPLARADGLAHDPVRLAGALAERLA